MAYLVLSFWAVSLFGQSPSSLRIEVTEGNGVAFQPGAVSYKGISVRITDATGTPVPGIPVRFILPESGPTGLFPNGANSEMQVSDAQGRASVWGIHWGKSGGVVRVAIMAGSGTVTAGLVLPVRLGNGPVPPPAVQAPPAPSPAVTVAPPPVQRPATPTPAARPTEASFEVPAKSPFPSPMPPAAAPLLPSAGIQPAAGPTPDIESRGVIFTRNVGPVERFPSSSRRKWVVVSLSVAGAVGGGLAYRMLNRTATPSAAAVTAPPASISPPLSLSAPVITVGKP